MRSSDNNVDLSIFIDRVNVSGLPLLNPFNSSSGYPEMQLAFFLKNFNRAIIGIVFSDKSGNFLFWYRKI